MSNILQFSHRQAFREWLEKYGCDSEGVWLLFGKKGGPETLSANDALEEALCYGWIDGQMQSIDSTSYKKYFARRTAQSNWSDKNKKIAETLIEKKLMTDHGMNAIEKARKNGSWETSSRIVIDDEQIGQFLQIVQPYETAYTNLMAMPLSVRRSYTGLYLDAKTDKTRQTRLEKIIDRLNKNLKPM
ncbi:YdeI/OmpD-associated family protein [Brucepastera parasyntrophica]|uniref:YdeI/OmpD-associated family protein n=1 Tax=Brucepastera parasyntrophica TaxID=2880008 RepID=UPI00210E9123|nr:YdeI/OmpD-associated family protein [Brucepastera parasyntrophica]ULQ60424.1 YdeI/OmpD-associated family protein [Brucepastera parasyntrophica]